MSAASELLALAHQLRSAAGRTTSLADHVERLAAQAPAVKPVGDLVAMVAGSPPAAAALADLLSIIMAARYSDESAHFALVNHCAAMPSAAVHLAEMARMVATDNPLLHADDVELLAAIAQLRQAAEPHQLEAS